MASDYLLEIDGIKGESTDDKHKGAIDIESFSWGLSNASSANFGGGAAAGKVNFQDFHFTKRCDVSSPELMLSCATGQHIKKATLFVRKAGREQHEYMKVNMEDLLVSSFNQGGDATGEGSVPTDQFSLNFSKIVFEYRPQNPDGSLDAAVKAGYDVKANKKV